MRRTVAQNVFRCSTLHLLESWFESSSQMSRLGDLASEASPSIIMSICPLSRKSNKRSLLCLKLLAPPMARPQCHRDLPVPCVPEGKDLPTSAALANPSVPTNKSLVPASNSQQLTQLSFLLLPPHSHPDSPTTLCPQTAIARATAHLPPMKRSPARTLPSRLGR